MKILAMDTSTWALAVGIVDDGQLVGELNTNLPKNHSLRLMPAIEALLQHVGMKPAHIDGLAVAYGPGSYTGVRIGVTTAKTMAWALDVPLVGVSSLQVVAQNRSDFAGYVIPMFDARRDQVYTGIYKRDEEYHKPVMEDQLLEMDTLMEKLKQYTDQPLLFIGEGALVFQDRLKEAFQERALFAAQHEHVPKGSQLAFLAWKQWNLRKVEGKQLHAFAPRYLQLAEAERKWMESQKETQC